MISSGYVGFVGLSGALREVGSREWRNVEEIGTESLSFSLQALIRVQSMEQNVETRNCKLI